MPQDLVPVGLTKVRDGFDFNMTVGHIEISHGYSCLYPQEINAHLGYYVPTIYILKDLQKGTCLYEVALRHEKTHMQIYIEALDYFLPEFKKRPSGSLTGLACALSDRANRRTMRRGSLTKLILMI